MNKSITILGMVPDSPLISSDKHSVSDLKFTIYARSPPSRQVVAQVGVFVKLRGQAPPTHDSHAADSAISSAGLNGASVSNNILSARVVCREYTYVVQGMLGVAELSSCSQSSVGYLIAYDT